MRRDRFASSDSDEEEVKIGDTNPPPKKKTRGKSVGGKVKQESSDVSLGVIVPLSVAK